MSDPVAIKVGMFCLRVSARGIPRVVRVRSVSDCGRYCVITYSVLGTKRHQCRIDELTPDLNRGAGTWAKPIYQTAIPPAENKRT